MRLDGGRRHTSSSHAGFRLTEGGGEYATEYLTARSNSHTLIYNICLTCEGDDENDGDVDEEELEVSQIAENLWRKKKRRKKAESPTEFQLIRQEN